MVWGFLKLITLLFHQFRCRADVTFILHSVEPKSICGPYVLIHSQAFSPALQVLRPEFKVKFDKYCLAAPLCCAVLFCSGKQSRMSVHFSNMASPRNPPAYKEPSIFVVSNRLPFVLVRDPETSTLTREPSAGGLVTALSPIVKAQNGRWIGWPGIELEEDEEIPDCSPSAEADSATIVLDIPTTQLSAVHVDAEDINGYYTGFSNSTLWPLFHSMPDRCVFEPSDFESYKKVNGLFAEKVIEELDAFSKSDDAETRFPMVWIQDYQLLLVAQLVRRRARPVLHKSHGTLCFFLHIPFPPYDVFRILPWDKQLLLGLLGCDLIGFHIKSYALNFLDCVEKRLGARVDRQKMTIEYGGRQTRVGAFPIGIPYRKFSSMAKPYPPVEPTDTQLILGVDRLDPTKGIPNRLLAFEMLLQDHPELIGKVTMLQVAVPSRVNISEYQALKTKIDTLIGRINGNHSTDTYSPIHYIYRGLPQSELAKLYSKADVCLVNPLRDGMNLVCKEFVACQNPADPGVLILSRFTGAAETMREALLVNPYNVMETAESIYRALQMELPERISRMIALKAREKRNDVHQWTKNFLNAARPVEIGGSVAKMRPVNVEDFDRWLGRFIAHHRLSLLLDYDGTLAPIAPHPSEAFMTQECRKNLNAVIERGVTVAVISGRALDDVKKMVNIDNIVYAGNHGLEIEIPGFSRFVHPDLIHFREKVEELAKLLQRQCNTDGAWVEKKGPTLTFHFRQVPDDLRPKLVAAATDIISSFGFQARPAHCAVEGRPPIGWDKGRASLHILRTLFGASWSKFTRAVYVGDDETDEDAFRVLGGLAVTFRLGRPETVTFAKHRLEGPEDVSTLLEYVASSYDANAVTDPKPASTPAITATIS